MHTPLLEITKSYRGVLLDAYGVFWSGNAKGLIAGSNLAMESLVKEGKVVGILSNATRLGHLEVEKLKKSGLYEGVHFHFFITSGDIARATLLSKTLPFPVKNPMFYVFGGPYPKGALHEEIFANTDFKETLSLEEASFIYVSTPQIQGVDQTDPKVFSELVQRCAQQGLPMLCANPDLFAHEGLPPKAVVRQGSIASMYEAIGGKVYYIGKPHKTAFSKALDAFRGFADLKASDIIMIGDTPETDVRGANAFGMSSALITQTGITAERLKEVSNEEYLMHLPQTDTPRYLLQRLEL